VPGYRTHARVSKRFVFPATFVASWIMLGGHLRLDAQTGKELYFATVTSLGAMAGNGILSPDLDTVSSPYHKWGCLRFLWIAYQVMIGHRSPVSHWPILGGVFQHVWILVEVILLIYLSVLAWNFVLIPHTDLGRILNAPPINVGLVDIAKGILLPLWRSPTYWAFSLGHCLVGQPAHCIMDYADSRRRRHYRGQPMRPPEEDERRAVKGKLWED
jgi:uncharacterized metal-binding protein